MSRPRATLDDPRMPELIRLYASGLNIPTAAQRVGMCRKRAAQLLREAGVEIRETHAWPPERLETIRLMRHDGKTWVQIAVSLGCLPESARRYYRKRTGRLEQIPTPEPVEIGPASERPEALSERVSAEVQRFGAVVLLRHRGRYYTAAPGSAVAHAAEVERAIVGTYVEGVRPDWIADDIRSATV